MHTTCIHSAHDCAKAKQCRQMENAVQMAESDAALRGGSNVISNATVSGNLHDCRPLFIDEYGILLCASGYSPFSCYEIEVL